MRQSSILLHIRFRLHDLDVAACGVGIRTQLVRRDDKQEFIGFHADIEEQQRHGDRVSRQVELIQGVPANSNSCRNPNVNATTGG